MSSPGNEQDLSDEVSLSDDDTTTAPDGNQRTSRLHLEVQVSSILSFWAFPL